MTCSVSTPGSQCASFAANLFGPHPESYDEQIFQLLLAHCPSGASLKEFEHFNQLVQSGIFRPYERDGIECIHQPYNLSASSAPVSIFYGLNDWIVHPKNVIRLASLLPNLREVIPVGGKKFNHVDFIIGTRVRAAVYRKLLQNLRNDSQAYLSISTHP
ncbi:lipase 1-like [Anopheles darlingi]|uniref:lipase 1-like n=1 Tax=Anopheles darlingi TaxID=43151 RepID=UPI0021004340|nr:lipase 1-like [Anopheles darlingi]